MHKDVWTDRQEMGKEHTFEFYHYLDKVAPEVDFHQHPFYELLFFLAGSADYTIEGKTYRLKPGDILLTNPSDVHRPEIQPGKTYERVVIWLSVDFFTQLGSENAKLSAIFTDAATKDYRRIRPGENSVVRLFHLCDKISRAQSSGKIGSAALCYAFVIEFLVEVCRCYYETRDLVPEDVSENEKINQVLAYINARITEEISLEALAEHFYLSKFYLSRQFKQYAGLSIYQYIMKKRLSMAREMIQSGTPATTACLECGFNDYSNFLKAFRREFEQTPRQMAKEVQ